MVIFHKTEVQMVILRCLMGLNLEFWKYDSWFPSDVSKLTSVWNKLNLSLKYWCIEARLVSCTCYSPKKLSKCHLGTIQTTFSEDSNYYRGNIGENLFLSSLKMLYFRGSLPKWILTPQKKTSCHSLKIWNLDLLSTSKWPSEPQFCERWTCIFQKNGQKWLYNLICGVSFISNQSI